MSKTRPRILIADDDPQVCKAVSRFLSSSCDVVGCVAEGASVCDATLTLRPDIVLLDFSLSGGLEVCRRLASQAPAVSVVAFTGNNDAELKRLALEAGAAAFVWKVKAP